jgi:hypothetical protein
VPAAPREGRRRHRLVRYRISLPGAAAHFLQPQLPPHWHGPPDWQPQPQPAPQPQAAVVWVGGVEACVMRTLLGQV